MSLLAILLLVALLVMFAASFCFWINHGGFIGFYMAGQVAEGIGYVFHALIHIIGECLANE